MKTHYLCIALAFALNAGPAAAQSHDRSIEVEAEVNAPVEKVWEMWTTCEGIKSFFAKGCNIDLRIDGAFAMYFAPDAPEGSRGADRARILALQPNRMLSFTWDAAPPGNPVRANLTHVVVRFYPLPENRTRVTLVNDGYGEGEDWDKAYTYLSGAWNHVLGSLKKRLVEEYEERPKKAIAGTRTQQMKYAQYAEDWRIKIERVGTLNFPEAARGTISRTLRLTAEIRANGSVNDIQVDRSSGVKEIDEAAKRIVRMAAPFPAFPPSLKGSDILFITRTWTFEPGGSLSTE